jgi:membrane-associated protein
MSELIPLVTSFGYIGIFATVFLESGLFIFFLPGDSLLFTVGLFASQDIFNIYLLLPLIFIAAVLGDSVGYFIGKKIEDLENHKYIKREHFNKTHQFFVKHGPRAIILARFVPIVRTFIPVLAGFSEMEYKKFLKYNIIGAAIWTVLVCGAGFIIGNTIPHAKDYLEYIILGIVFVSFLPIVFEYIRNKKS